MGHDEGHHRPLCLGVFDSGAIVATYAQPGASLRSQAARVRARLKREWRDQRFDVRVEAHRVHTCWTDGPALDVVSDVLRGCDATSQRMTWRRTRRGIVADQLTSVIYDGRTEAAAVHGPTRSAQGVDQNPHDRFWTARADASLIADVLLQLADGRDATAHTVLDELGLETVATIVDVDLGFAKSTAGPSRCSEPDWPAPR
jgi:hypothetical protein